MEFSFPAVPGELSTVSLSVIVAADKGGGTAIRADAQVVWTQPRPAAEHIPAAVKVVTIKARDHRRHISFTTQITIPSKVGAIIALVEGLQRPPSGGVCAGGALENGKEPEPVIDLTFREARGAPPLVRVRIDENTGCGGSISFWTDGHEQPDLAGAVEATKALHTLLGRSL